MDPKIVLYIIVWIIIWLIFWFLISKIYFLMKLKKYWQLSVKKSKEVILGEVNEKIAPILPNFPYNYKDLVFVGKWIDYVVFDGLSEGNLKKVVFLEVKTWKSTLNKNEKSIKSIVESKKVFYELFKI